MGFGSFVDGIGEFILPEEPGNLRQRTSDIFQKSLGAASMFGLKGDTADIMTAVTGFDPFRQQEVSGIDRWMGVLGAGALGGGVLGGARMADLGFPAATMLTRGRRGPSIAPGTANFDLTPGGRVMKETRAIDQSLLRLNDEEGLVNPDHVFLSSQKKTAEILRLNVDRTVNNETVIRGGWEDMARATGATPEGTPGMAGYLEGVLGPRLTENTPSLVAYGAQRIDDPDPHADMKGVAFIVSQWEFADSWEKFRFEGEVGPLAMAEWHKLKNGATDINSELLANAQAKFAVGFDWVQDPELRLNPMVSVSHINLDGEQAVVSLKALQWKQVSYDQLTGRAVQERTKALLGMHPSNMILLLKDNLRQLVDQALQKPQGMDWEDWMTDMRHMPTGLKPDDPGDMIAGWRDWYSNAREAISKKSVELRAPFKAGHLDENQLRNLRGHAAKTGGTADEQRLARNARKQLKAYEETRGMGSRHFATDESSAGWLTVVAALTSAGEDWNKNVDKAMEVARYLHGPKRAKTVAKMHADINSLGIKVPENDLVKILLLEGLDDPVSIFRTGRAGTVRDPGYDTQEIIRRLNKGEDVAELVQMRIIPAAWVSQKQDSFAYAIMRSRPHELEERAEYLADMMRGELGAKLQQTPGGADRTMTGTEVRELLPVVADRQHFKAALGFSLVPDTWYASDVGSYDQFAQAARVVAGEMGEIAGKQVLPEEVQAVAWMRYRAMSHYTDPMGRDWPMAMTAFNQKVRDVQRGNRNLKKGEEPLPIPEIDAEGKYQNKPVVDFNKKEMGQTVGTRRDSTGTATWQDGAGADLMFSNNIMKYITGENIAPLPSTRMVDAATDLTRYRINPRKLGFDDSRITAANYEEIQYEIALDGSVKWLGEEGQMPRRGHYQTSAESNGLFVYAPSKPRQVSNLSDEFDLILESTRQLDDPQIPIGSGASLHSDPASRAKMPFYREGPMMSITVQSSFEGDGGMATNYMARQGTPAASGPGDLENSALAGGSGRRPINAHARIKRELERRGFKFKIDDMSTHQGLAPHWELSSGELTWDDDVARKEFGANYMSKATPSKEGRRERVLEFETADDLNGVAKFLDSPATDHPPVAGAVAYMEEFFPGRTYRRPDPDRFMGAVEKRNLDFAHEEVGVWYGHLPEGRSSDPEVLKSYAALLEDVVNQAEFIEQKLGVKMVVVDYDPYNMDPAAMFRDIEKGQLKVMATQVGEHMYFTADENNLLRFVHDYFGHATNEVDFTRFGEEAAFASHVQMFSPEAQGALFTDLRGQTGALIANSEFQVQKMGLPPEEVLRWYNESYTDWRSDTWTRRLTGDDVADIRYYVDHPTDAPQGTTAFWEHHFTDENGGELINLNIAGGPHRSNVGQVFLQDVGLTEFVVNQRSSRLEPGGRQGHHFGGENLWDNRIQFNLPTGVEVKGNGKNIWGTQVLTPREDAQLKFKSKHLEEFHIYMPPPGEPGLPQAALTAEDLGHFDPSRVVKVRKGYAKVRKASASGHAGRGRSFLLELPNDGSGVDPILFDDVREAIVETNSIAYSMVIARERGTIRKPKLPKELEESQP